MCTQILRIGNTTSASGKRPEDEHLGAGNGRSPLLLTFFSVARTLYAVDLELTMSTGLGRRKMGSR